MWITKITTTEGELVEEEGKVITEAITYYQNQLTEQTTTEDLTLLQNIPELVTHGENDWLNAEPTMDVVKRVV